MPWVHIAVKQRETDILKGVWYGITRKILPVPWFHAGFRDFFWRIVKKLTGLIKIFFEMKNRN